MTGMMHKLNNNNKIKYIYTSINPRKMEIPNSEKLYKIQLHKQIVQT